MRSHVTTLLGLGSLAYAATNQICQGSLCYSLNIPDATAQSGKGDIFFQIQGPTSNSWIALGQGSSMSSSNIFVIYTSADGKNVTLSPRTGSGHSMPSPNSNAQVSLLDGSGVTDGKMTANIKCSNCDSWSGGSMDFSGTSNSWIFATKSGSAMNSDDAGASIQQHSNTYGTFKFDFAQAKGGSEANPFSGTATSSGTGSTATSKACRSKNGNSGSGSGSSGSSGSSGTATLGSATSTDSRPPWATGTGFPWGNNGGSSSRLMARDDDEDCDDSGNGGNQLGLTAGAGGMNTTMLIAHGVMACLAFAILFPAGGIMIRVLSFPGLWMAHAAVQTLAYLIYIAAFGLGVYIASKANYLDEYHPVIGIVLFILLFFQPFLGYIHHIQYMKYQSRTFWSYAHLWLGRIVITLGIVNGGLGFKLADNTKTGPIIYGVVAGIVWVTYVACIFIGERKRKKSLANAPPKYTESANSGSSPSGQGAPMEYYSQHNRRD